jgi:hypothetical protein
MQKLSKFTDENNAVKIMLELWVLVNDQQSYLKRHWLSLKWGACSYLATRLYLPTVALTRSKTLLYEKGIESINKRAMMALKSLTCI